MSEFHLKFHHSILFFSKHQNEIILANNLSISNAWVVLKPSVASVTPPDMITSLASMTSTAFLASKNPKNYLFALYKLSNITRIRILKKRKILNLMLPSILATKWPNLVYQCGRDHQKSTFLLIFGTLYVVEAMFVSFNQIQGSYVKWCNLGNKLKAIKILELIQILVYFI